MEKKDKIKNFIIYLCLVFILGIMDLFIKDKIDIEEALLQSNHITESIDASAVKLLPKIEDKEQDIYRQSYNNGNCRKLEGKPVVVLFFVDDDESKWTKEEVLEFFWKNILVALDYLEENAKKWGVELDFVIESYSTPLSNLEIVYEGTVVRDLLIDGSTKDVIDQVANDIGLSSNWELYSYYKSKYPDDDIIFLSFLNKSGRSYARNFYGTGYSEYAEHCVIFSKSIKDDLGDRIDNSRASTVVHELLHLFGAEDYYISDNREKISSQEYPDDIMRYAYIDINRNTIGNCTAFSVGWTDKVPDVCYNEKWWN